MNFYDDLVMQTQMNYSKYHPIYASGSTPYQLTDKKPLPYSEQIHRLVQEVKEADCVVVGGASGLYAFKTIEFAVYCPPRDDTNFKVFEWVMGA